MDESKDLNGRSPADPAASSSASSSSAPSDPAAAGPRAPAAAASAASAASSANQSRRASNAERKEQLESQRDRVLQHLNTQIELYLVSPSSPHVRLSAPVCGLLDRLLRLRHRGRSELLMRGRAMAMAETEYVLDDGSRWAERLKEMGFAAFAGENLFGPSSSSASASRPSADSEAEWRAQWPGGARASRAPPRSDFDPPPIHIEHADEVHIHHHYAPSIRAPLHRSPATQILCAALSNQHITAAAIGIIVAAVVAVSTRLGQQKRKPQAA